MEKKLSKSPFSEKELGFINAAFQNTSFKAKDLNSVNSLKSAIDSKFKHFFIPDIHVLKQVIDNSAIKGSDVKFVVCIIEKMEKLLEPEGK